MPQFRSRVCQACAILAMSLFSDRALGEVPARTAASMAVSDKSSTASGATRWTPAPFVVPELKRSLELAGRNLSSVLDPVTSRPYFGTALLADRPHLYHIDFFDVPHLTGRVLDAVLMSESIAGVPVDSATAAAYEQLIYTAFDGPDSLNGFINNKGERKVILHNMREGLSGLNALIQGRTSQRARDLAARMVGRVASLLNEDGSWNLEAIKGVPGILPPGEITGHDKFYPSTAGRFLGALVKYGELTGDAEAFRLAERIKNQVLATSFDSEGRITEGAGWHVHSITATINSLAQLAESTGDRDLMQKTARIYDAAHGRILTRFGWSKENLSNDLDTGEVNNTGDMIQTALILAGNGFPQYYSDAERMLRSHVLPSQLTDTSWVKAVAHPAGDHESDIPSRALGAWGFPAPYGHKIDRIPHVNFNFDITGGTAQAMCEVYRKVCVPREDSFQVNLLFSFSGPELAVRSALPQTGRLEVETSGTKEIHIRIPGGVAPEDVGVLADGQALPAESRRGYLILPKGIRTATVTFPLPFTRTEEQLPGRIAHVWWKGEQVIRMQTSGAQLPFFP